MGGGARLTLFQTKAETRGTNLTTEVQVEVNDAFSNGHGFGGFPESGARVFDRLGSSEGGDERVQGVGELVERTDLENLEMFDRGGKSKARK